MKVVVQCGINVSMGNQFLGMDKVNVKKTLIARIMNRRSYIHSWKHTEERSMLSCPAMISHAPLIN